MKPFCVRGEREKELKRGKNLECAAARDCVMEPVEPTNIRGNVLKYCMFGIETNQLSRKCTDGRKGTRTVKYVMINLGLL